MESPQINLQYTTIKIPLPDFIYEGLKDYSSGANLYRPQPLVLIEKLAKKYNVKNEMIFLTAGADEAIQMFIHAFGAQTFAFTPTYVVYSDVVEFGKKFTRLPSLVHDEYTISTSNKQRASLIFLANPNNPSGITSKKKIMELVKNNNNAIVVIDEAYGEFADLSVLDEVKNYRNLVVTRSFSKAYGMAGNRVGYIVAQPEIIDKVRNKTTWANVSYLSVGAATVALDHEEYFKKIRDDINTRREEFLGFLKSLKFTRSYLINQ